MKILINTCYGGYSLSHEAMLRYAELKGIAVYPESNLSGLYTYWLVPESQRVKQTNFYAMSQKEREASNALLDNREFRTDPTMIQVVEELGDKANGRFAELKVIEIPEGVDYTIEEYAGMEHIAEVHRTWS